jgi:heterodisulfide reductase subunit B2
MTLAYYPGCSLHGTSREFDESFRAVATALPIEMREIDDWSCCGASSAHPTNRTLGVALPARNLALAAEQGADEVVAPCAACFNRLSAARYELDRDAELAARMPGILGCEFANDVAVRNVVDVLLRQAPRIEELAAAQLTPNPLSQMKLAAYYGCLLVRPAEVTGFDDSEAPVSMETVISACGATPVKWNMAVECCGGAFSISRTSSVVRMSRRIIDDAREHGADAIVVSCPLCHSNLDFRQAAMQLRGAGPMPILFLTQLVGLAIGVPEAELGLSRHFVDTKPLFLEASAAAERAASDQAARAAAKAEKAAARTAREAVAAGASDTTSTEAGV